MNAPQSPETRLTELEEKIAGTAFKIARKYNRGFRNVEADDLASEMVLAILERAAEQPDFLAQTDAYIVNYGAWKARDWAKRQTTFNARELQDDPVSDDLDGATLLEMIEADNWDDTDRGLAIEQAMDDLSEMDQEICAGLASGYSVRDIAPSVGCSVPTVYNHMRGNIAEALSPVLA